MASSELHGSQMPHTLSSGTCSFVTEQVQTLNRPLGEWRKDREPREDLDVWEIGLNSSQRVRSLEVRLSSSALCFTVSVVASCQNEWVFLIPNMPHFKCLLHGKHLAHSAWVALSVWQVTSFSSMNICSPEKKCSDGPFLSVDLETSWIAKVNKNSETF